MRPVLRWGPVLAALGAVVLGVVQVVGLPQAAARRPAWGAVLAPLSRAPLRVGEAVALQLPARLSASPLANDVLYEAAWRRPDVRWAVSGSWPAGVPCRHVVTVGEATPPPGWRRVWSAGELAVYQRGPP